MEGFAIVLTIFAIASLVWGAVAGAQKGRLLDGLLWGLFAGPVGCLVVSCFLEDLTLPKCPFCRGRISRRAVRCRHCCANLPQQPQVQVPQTAWPVVAQIQAQGPK